jgi:hypothetical protein
MDSEGVKERFVTSTWLLFSETLAMEALYNILTRPTTDLLRNTFLGLLFPDNKGMPDGFSVRMTAEHGGTVGDEGPLTTTRDATIIYQ